MAGPYTGVTTTEPQASPTPYQNLNTPVATPAMYGGQVAEGLKELGTGAGRAAVFFGEAAADNAANQYQERLNEIMHGEPGKMVQGPDGQMVPDTGFMGLKGRAAMDARPDVDKRLEQLRTEIRGGLLTPQQSLRFDDFSRRYKTWAEGRIGQHADDQANRWYDQVENATANAAQKHIAVNFNDPVAVKEGQERLREAYVKKAQRNGGGPELVQAAMDKADRETAATLVMATAVTDPLKAQRIAEKSRMALGTMYDEVMNRIKPRAEAAEGRAYADAKLTEGVVGLKESTQAVLAEGTAALKAKGIDIGVSSGVRSPQQNAAAGGAEDSEHLHGGAIDIPWKGKSEAEKKEILAQFSGDPRVGGIGFYDSHIHVDTKAGRRTWGTQPQWAQADMQGWKGNVAPNAPTPKTQADLVNEVLDDPRLQDKPHAQQAAIARINQSYRLRNAEETKRKAEFDGQLKDNVAAVQKIGGVEPRPMTEQDFVRHYGPESGPTKYADYSEEISFANAWHSLQDMPDNQQISYLNSRAAQLDTTKPGFARAQAYQARLEKAVNEIQKTRREDPWRAVARDPTVAAAVAQFDPQNPATFRPVVEASLAAQQQMGIEPEFQSPISKDMAMKLTVPLARAIPGHEDKALQQVGESFRTLFGEHAPAALAYAISARKIHGTVAEQAGNMILALSEGKPITDEDRRQLAAAQDRSASEAALTAAPWPSGKRFDSQMTPVPARPRVIGNPEDRARPFMGEGAYGQSYPPPTPKAISSLIKGTMSAAQFDMLFGPGASKALPENVRGLLKAGGSSAP